MAITTSGTTPLLIVLGVVALFGIITFALTAATLGTLNKNYDALRQQIDDLKNRLPTAATTTLPTTTTTTTSVTPPTTTSISQPTGVNQFSDGTGSYQTTAEQKPPAAATTQNPVSTAASGP